MTCILRFTHLFHLAFDLAARSSWHTFSYFWWTLTGFLPPSLERLPTLLSPGLNGFSVCTYCIRWDILIKSPTMLSTCLSLLLTCKLPVYRDWHVVDAQHTSAQWMNQRMFAMALSHLHSGSKVQGKKWPFRNSLCNAISIILVMVQSTLEHQKVWYKEGKAQGQKRD